MHVKFSVTQSDDEDDDNELLDHKPAAKPSKHTATVPKIPPPTEGHDIFTSTIAFP